MHHTILTIIFHAHVNISRVHVNWLPLKSFTSGRPFLISKQRCQTVIAPKQEVRKVTS